jgi:hypothetical protein
MILARPQDLLSRGWASITLMMRLSPDPWRNSRVASGAATIKAGLEATASIDYFKQGLAEGLLAGSARADE